ncbi:MAG: hypothetical protein HYY20_11930 [Candidatus Tectomicrobia bacterium]|uniref:Uncharacterized protein n=1 Tax=Tectimicrobiota bacterium TaxID=2528274 RepID=A0A932CQS4_UNCTE|nr:hypothetical protein [Candidatus Tectomicrobia bacterium]
MIRRLLSVVRISPSRANLLPYKAIMMPEATSRKPARKNQAIPTFLSNCSRLSLSDFLLRNATVAENCIAA